MALFGLKSFAFFLLSLFALALATPARIDYAEVRRRVAQALPAKADEMAGAIAALQHLSQSSADMLARLVTECGKP